MVQIQFKQTGKYGNINVQKGENWSCKLFDKYTHTNTNGRIEQPFPQGDIYLCKENGCKTKCTLKRDIYNEDSLDYIIVYSNKYNSNFPLILILGFNRSKNLKRKYFKLFDFNSRSLDINISSLKNYDGEDTIVETLIDENDRIDDPLTFKIDNKNVLNNGLYNNLKIKLTDDSHTTTILKTSGFKKFKHEPQPSHGSKNGCVIFNNDILYTRDKNPMNIQNKNYHYINVYYSDNVSEPLLLELCTQNSKTNTNEFYYLTRTTTGSLYWEKISKGSNVFGVVFNTDNIYQELNSQMDLKFLELLKKLTSHLLKTLFVMLNHKSEYSHLNVNVALKLSSVNQSKYRLLNKRPVIKVADKTSSIGLCISKHGYKSYEHDFTDTVEGIKNTEKVEIKFVRSNPENTILNINLDRTSGSYEHGPYQIQVSINSNLTYKYNWLRHSSESDIFNTKFKVQFKGQSVIFKSEKAISDLNSKVLFVYFNTDAPDTFVLLVFTSKNDEQIWYMNYFNFKKHVSDGKPIELSSLSTKKASTRTGYVSSQINVHGSNSDRIIEPSLREFLDQEKANNYSIRIELGKPSGQTYNYGSLSIKVAEQKSHPYVGFNMYEYYFEAQKDVCDIVFYHNHDTKTLDITDLLNKEKVNSVSLYFNNGNTTIPLIVGIYNGSVYRYFKYAEFVSNFNNTVKISYLSKIEYTELKANLEDQGKKMGLDVTFKINQTKDYGGNDTEMPVNVLKGDQFDDYIYYTHISKNPFKQIKIDQNGFKIERFNDGLYTYNKFLYLNAYFHVNDKQNAYPLLICLYTKTVNSDLKRIDISDTLYSLNISDNNKIYKSISSSGNILYTLYSVLNGELKSHLSEILKGSNYSNYGEVNLYSGEDVNSSETLYYNHGKNKLYLVFYRDDPRPLLICYEGTTFRPKIIDNPKQSNQISSDYLKWFRVKNNRNGLCNGVGDSVENQNLLNVLTQVTCSINPVELNPTRLPVEISSKIRQPPQNGTYNIHEYILGTPIKVQISSIKLTCYKKISYNAYGTTSTTGKGFRLGAVLYTSGSGKTSYVTYTSSSNHKHEPLLTVDCYYFDGDNTFTNPLLVILEFKGGNKEYYKLNSSANGNCSWTLDSSLNEGNLLNELFTLNKKFNKSKNPDESECNPSNNTPEIAGGVTTTFILGGGGVAGGVLYYKYPGVVLSLISKIIPK